MPTKDKAKKPYKKPEIKQVKLEVGEAVLAGCKASTGDPTGKFPKNCGFPACKDYTSVS
jgi:hypothetical protein